MVKYGEIMFELGEWYRISFVLLRVAGKFPTNRCQWTVKVKTVSAFRS